MSVKKLFVILMLVGSLGACVNEPQQIVDVHTGITAGSSKRYSVYEGLLVNVYAKAVIATKGKDVRYGIYVDQIATATGWSFFNSAYSFGVELPYKRESSSVLGCAGGCTVREEGLIGLSFEQFSVAKGKGMEIKLVGSGNSVVIKVPAEAFREAAAMVPVQAN